MPAQARWRLLAALDLTVAALVVLRDTFLPTMVILVLAAVSLLIRRENLSTPGLMKAEKPWRMILAVALPVIAWSIFQLGRIMPILNRLTGTTQDLSRFANLQGNLEALLMFLGVT